jgi:GTP-binding protein
VRNPISPRDGTKLTARLVKARLDAELVGNVSLRVLATDKPDRWEVQGRGELQLAVLVETMRREGFELTVGKPQVLTHQEDGRLLEPYERVSIDVPEEHVGTVTQLLGARRARMEQMIHQGSGWVRTEWTIPARGLIGFRTEFLTETRGTGVLHHVFDGWQPWAGEIRSRPSGSIVADRVGVATFYAIESIQERATLFIGPGTDVYGGMIVGENSRPEDMDVNICREKKVTNIRSSTAEATVTLVPPRVLTLDQALEFIGTDECVEVTPAVVRLRKVELDPNLRARARKAAKSLG